MGTNFRGSNSSIFIFAFLLNGGQLLKVRTCSSESKFFPLKVDTFLGGLRCPWKLRGNSFN